MIKTFLKHPVAVISAILLHVLIVGLFVLSFDWTEKPEVADAGIPVSIILPDAEALEKPAINVAAKKELIQEVVEPDLTAESIKAAEVLEKKQEQLRLAKLAVKAKQEAELKIKRAAEKELAEKKQAKIKADERKRLEQEEADKKRAEKIVAEQLKAKQKKKKEEELAEKERIEQEQRVEEKRIKEAKQKEKQKEEVLAKKKLEKDKAEEQKKEALAEQKAKAEKEAKQKARKIAKAKKAAQAKKEVERLAKEKEAKKRKEAEERAAKVKAEKAEAERIAKKKAAEKAAAIKAAKLKAEKEAAEKLAAKKAEYHRKWQEAQEKKKADALAAEAKKKTAAASAANRASLEKAKRGAQLSWGSKIQRHVKRRWHPPPGTNGKSAKVKITVSASGYISSGIKVLSCNGSEEFCISVKEAFEQAEPLPRPPSKYNFNKSDRTITFKMD